MKIVYLYTEVMGYTQSTIKELANQGNLITVIHWDKEKLTPFVVDDIEKVQFYPKSQFTLTSIYKFIRKIDPDIIVISGWQDKFYLLITCYLKIKGYKIIAGLDQRWKGTIKQYISQFIGFLGFFRFCFNGIWIPGIPQYLYAKKIGFSDNQIRFDLYSCDTQIFDSKNSLVALNQNNSKIKRFIFLGRFEKIKGLTELKEAWSKFHPNSNDWTLTLIGNGSLKESFINIPGVIVIDFLQPLELVKEMYNGGILILPSNDEAWGVVVHEAVSLGMPLLLSNAVGSGSTFLIEGLNGFYFDNGNPTSLYNRLFEFSSLSESQINLMRYNSISLSNRISPITSAFNLLSFKS